MTARQASAFTALRCDSRVRGVYIPLPPLAEGPRPLIYLRRPMTTALLAICYTVSLGNSRSTTRFGGANLYALVLAGVGGRVIRLLRSRKGSLL